MLDLNPQWVVSQWVLNNAIDIVFWLAAVRYVSNSILENIPAAKANTGFEAICNTINSLYEGAKSLGRKL